MQLRLLLPFYITRGLLLQYFDVDGDGLIEYEEFVNTLKRLDIGLSDSQV